MYSSCVLFLASGNRSLGASSILLLHWLTGFGWDPLISGNLLKRLSGPLDPPPWRLSLELWLWYGVWLMAGSPFLKACPAFRRLRWGPCPEKPTPQHGMKRATSATSPVAATPAHDCGGHPVHRLTKQQHSALRRRPGFDGRFALLLNIRRLRQQRRIITRGVREHHLQDGSVGIAVERWSVKRSSRLVATSQSSGVTRQSWWQGDAPGRCNRYDPCH